MLEDPITLSYHTSGSESFPWTIAKLQQSKPGQSTYYRQNFHASGRLDYRDDYLVRNVKQNDGRIRCAISVQRTQYADEDGAVAVFPFVTSISFTVNPDFDEIDLVAALAQERALSGWLGDETANTNLTRLVSGEL